MSPMVKVVGTLGVILLIMLLFAPIALGLAFQASLGGGDNNSSGDSAGDFSGECKAKGVAYGLPSTNAADREAVFGKPNTDIVKGTFFGKPVQMHKKVMACLEAVEKDLKAQDTSYTVREPIPSLRIPPDNLGFFHPYGAAVDINQSDNPMCGVFDPKGLCGKDGKLYDMPKEWVKTFQKYGFFWGGNYRTTKDFMHFEWHGEKP